MPQSCTICRHPEQPAIDGALIESEPLRNIAERFGTTATTLYRHRQHLPSQLIKAKQAQEIGDATSLLRRIESLIRRLDSLSQQAEEDRAWAQAIAAIREIRSCLTLLAQLSGELQAQNSTNINVSIVSERIQASVLAASADDFAAFCKALLEKASDEQKSAALAVIPSEYHSDLSLLTDEELDTLERLAGKIRRPHPTGNVR